jgi:LPS export ABC transporter protein LptC
MRRLILAFGITLAVGACTSRGVVPGQGIAADSADQVMKTMEFAATRDGIKTALIQSDSAWVFQTRQVTDLKTMKMTFYDKNGNVASTVTADSGSYQMRDGTLDARGNVVVVTTDGKTLKTEHLVYNKTTSEITSDTAYTFTSSQGSGSGMGFVTDPDFKRLETSQATGRQRGEGFILPGQTQGPQ